MTDLRPDDTPENNFWYTFKVQCGSCREVHPNYVNVSRFVCLMALSKIERGTKLIADPGSERYEWKSRRSQFCMEVQILQGIATTRALLIDNTCSLSCRESPLQR